MNPFPPQSQASAILEEICQELPRLALTPGARRGRDWPAVLRGLGDSELLGCRVADASMALAVRSGLLLRADWLAESHELSQKIATTTGSYWHGIVHRREPDFDNARYWFGRVGEHAVFSQLVHALAAARDQEGSAGLGEAAAELLVGGGWDPFRFVDACEACHRGKPSLPRQDLERIQELETLLLLGYCYEAAVGGQSTASLSSR